MFMNNSLPSLEKDFDSKEKQISSQFLNLLQRSNRYFSGLRELPQSGQRKVWEPYFRKTFEVFTQLWKYQLEHRSILEKKGVCNLKRFEIGEIASRIGQLYYLYYLRTGDIRYVYESYRFYEAIHTRQYFKNIEREDNAQLFYGMLRYYARFIVVCLLVNKRQIIYDILPEFKDNTSTYLTHFNITGKGGEEWELLINELENFLKSETIVTIDQSVDLINYRSLVQFPKSKSRKNNIPNYLFESQSRSGSNTPSSDDSSPIDVTSPVEESIFSQMSSSNYVVKISEAILVSNRKSTIKFSELTLDVFRIIQSLEKNSLHEKHSAIRKSMLYRPTCSDFLINLSSSMDNSEPTSQDSSSNINYATFLYISADGAKNGLSLNSRRRNTQTSTPYSFDEELSSETSHLIDPNSLTVDDILPFTRKPLFLIVESDNSTSLLPKQNRYPSCFVCLLSPKLYIPQLSTVGSFFTHFLSSPILALSLLTGVKNVDKNTFRECEGILINSFTESHKILVQEDELDISFKLFLENETTRLFILRFLLCKFTLQSYLRMNNYELISGEKHLPSFLPSSYPNIPNVPHDIFTKTLTQILEKLEVDTKLFFEN